MAFSDARRCTAKAKTTGEQCRNPAVTGYSVCRMHGAGNRKKPGGRPVEHGRYSKNLPDRMVARYQEAQQDTRLLELRDDIALVDARVTELLERLGDGEDATIWAEVYTLIEQRRRLVDSESRRLSELQQSISVSQALALIALITDTAKRYVTDDESRRALAAEMRRIANRGN